MSTPNPITFRRHHFLCALGFRSEGYSDGFTANMAAIVNGRLRAPDGGTAIITVTDSADTLCGPCPDRRGVSCVKAAKIARLDAAHGAALEISAGDQLTWAEAQQHIADNIVPDDLDHLCAGCQWLAMGACKDSLRHLHQRR